MAYEHLIVERIGPVARVILNRPHLHNAFNDRVVAELTEGFSALGVDGNVRAIVLTGAGASFCAGADLAWMQRAASYSVAENEADAGALVEMLEAIDTCAKPVVARVNGAALAGGAGLVAVCDIAIAAEGARFGFTEARLGLAPATISPYVVRKIGESHARALFLTAERFPARRALTLGLVHQVVPPEELDAAVDVAVGQLLLGGPVALSENKALLRGIRRQPDTAVGGYTASVIARLRTSPEGQEGLHAFLEKRPPAWVANPGPRGV